MISFGENIPKLAVIGKFIVVIVNSFDCMDDFKASIDDMGEAVVTAAHQHGTRRAAGWRR